MSEIKPVSEVSVAEPDLKKSKVVVAAVGDKVNVSNSKPSTTKKNFGKKNNKVRKFRPKQHDPTSPIGVLEKEIEEVLKLHNLGKSDILNDVSFIINCEDRELIDSKYHTVVENVEILRFTSNGDGLALIDSPFENRSKRVVTVPFGIPGDIAKIRIFRTNELYCEGDLLEVTQPSKDRDDSLIKCAKYFGKCSGCQYQNIAYETQLAMKRQTIENAYKYFTIAENQEMYMSKVQDTVGSPLQYDYRTKLTPHFDIGYSLSKKLKRIANEKHNKKKTPAKDAEQQAQVEETIPAQEPETVEFERPNLGFGVKGKPTWREFPEEVKNCRGSVLDIENCVIGTKTIQDGMQRERAKFVEGDYKNYTKGATILLREDTEVNETDFTVQKKTCVTDPKQIVVELVNGKKFEFIAGEFFQNNNSILPAVIEHVNSNLEIPNVETRYLVDAYCGSGLFSISCSDNVDKVIGVEISQEAVKFAEKNSQLNKIENCKFVVGEAQKIFKEIDTPADQTSVILDPPRKGCDEVFLKQLSEYKPAKIVYISCNVHSQARDVDWFLTKSANGGEYKVESIMGFDFFPQTHHVESVCVLTRV